MMYPLLVTSIVALAVILERTYAILIRTNAIDRESLRQLFALIRSDKYDDAKALLDQHPNSFTPVFVAILYEPDEAL